MVIKRGLEEFQIFTIPKLSKLETHFVLLNLIHVTINGISLHVNHPADTDFGSD